MICCEGSYIRSWLPPAAVFLSSSTILLHFVFGRPSLLLPSGLHSKAVTQRFLSVFPHYMTNPVPCSTSHLIARSVHCYVLLDLLVGESSSCTCIGNQLTGRQGKEGGTTKDLSTSKLSKSSSRTLRIREEAATILMTTAHCYTTHYLQQNRL